ncbi:MAG TPA: dipeptide epimerase [Candidatus Polarisedimenticolia bacterium]|jgi:L-alanine-DL-glutamate epimerase-like enolase superfamily enzyme|nr:dipeptide epimerase [Candidatus Polarisedimenticolia bacterium]
MIRILHVEAIPISFRLAEGYRIAGHTYTTADNILLKVDTSDGRTGFGCAAPAAEVTGETAAAALLALQDRLLPLLRESDAADPAGFARRARDAAPGAPGARAAAEMALYDLAGRRARVPLMRLLGMRRDRLPTSITLGIDDEAATLDRALRFRDAGFRILKVKIGEDWEQDLKTLRSLRRSLGPAIVLRADGNQGYRVDQARRFLAALEPGEIELLEQPTPADDLEGMRRLADEFATPIMADESVQDARDAARLVEARAADLVNIKLMKSGGIGEAMEIARRTGGAGLGAMIGCMDESRIGIAAALHFALAAPNVERADLDGHLDLVDDVARGGVLIDHGDILPLHDEDGLGVRVNL